MPRVIVDTDFDGIDTVETVQEVAPIAEQLGKVPQIQDLESILDPYAPAPSVETPATEENVHAH